MVCGVCGWCVVCVDGTWCVWMVRGVCGWCVVCVDGVWCVWMVRGVCGWYVVCVNSLSTTINILSLPFDFPCFMCSTQASCSSRRKVVSNVSFCQTQSGHTSM